jgi:hypothetical protein
MPPKYAKMKTYLPAIEEILTDMESAPDRAQHVAEEIARVNPVANQAYAELAVLRSNFVRCTKELKNLLALVREDNPLEFGPDEDEQEITHYFALRMKFESEAAAT